jgi:Ni/Fe-hydrogenase subunit HybB-like protein
MAESNPRLFGILILYVPLIPDIATCRDKIKGASKFRMMIYRVLSLGWADSPEQLKKIKKYLRLLLILVIPIALAIHTVTAWMFAMTLRTGWDSSIFGPYFVSGAFVAGCAAVIIGMFVFMKVYKLENYITREHFDKMGKLLVLTALVYVYFNINELIVPAFKLKTGDAAHIQSMFFGHDSVMFWLVQIAGLIVPFVLMLFKPMRRPLPITFLSVLILLGAWFKRYLIVVPTQMHPYLPIQNVPEDYHYYSPTTPEIAITLASFIIVLLIITVLGKLFPVVPIWELKEKQEKAA